MSEANPVGRPETSLQSKFDAGYIPVPESGCWIWMGGSDKDRYGLTSYKCKSLRAHRVSWTLHKGDIPHGLCVCHKCDTPACVNPDHLFVGSVHQNNIDRHRKGRDAVMERSGNSRFSKDDVLCMRHLHSIGQTYSEIAKIFITSPVSVRNCVMGKTWRSLPRSDS